MSSVAFHAVNKWYGDMHVLRDINLQIPKGEKLVICGPSGSGKSTLIRTINGLETIGTGTLTVAGTSLTDATARQAVRRNVGMVFQAFNLFTHLKIIDNITLAPEALKRLSRPEAHDKAMQLLDRVGLVDQANKYPGQLSGGQQQRVAIARTLMMDPEILLFDEPTSALDPEMIAEVLALMEDLARDGTTMVCVTHEMGFARNVADRILFMSDGCVVEQASPSGFFDAPKSKQAQSFLASLNYS